MQTTTVPRSHQILIKYICINFKGPRPNAQIHLPTISPCEQLSSQKICYSSYLERMGSDVVRNKNGGPRKFLIQNTIYYTFLNEAMTIYFLNLIAKSKLKGISRAYPGKKGLLNYFT